MTKLQMLYLLVGVLLVVTLGNSVVAGIALHRISHVAAQNTAVNCAQKATAQARVVSTADFLAKHPGKEPIPGVSREALIQSLEQARAERDAFADLDC